MSYTILRRGEVTARKEHLLLDLRSHLFECGVYKWDNENKVYVVVCEYGEMSKESFYAFQSFLDAKWKINVGEKHYTQHIKDDYAGMYTYRYPIGIYKAMVELDLFDE